MSRVTIDPPRPGTARDATAFNTALTAFDTALDAVDRDNLALEGLVGASFADGVNTPHTLFQNPEHQRASTGTDAVTSSWTLVTLGSVAMRLDGTSAGGFTVAANEILLVVYALEAVDPTGPLTPVPAGETVEARLAYQASGGGVTAVTPSQSWWQFSEPGYGSLGGFGKLGPGSYDWVEIQAQATSAADVANGVITAYLLRRV